MALSMDEQRMLAEIERRLAAEDPGLAAKMSSFRRPGPAAKLRTPRGRIIGSLVTVALLAVISLMVYAMIPFRAHGPKSTLTTQTATSQGILSTPAKSTKLEPLQSSAPRAGAAARASTANSAAAKATTSKTVASKPASKTAARTGASTRAASTANTGGTTAASARASS